MRIGLYGIRGVYNFGCEAIIRGCHHYLKTISPNCEIIYFSYNYSYDAHILADLDMIIYPVSEERSLFFRCVNKILSALRVERRLLRIPFRSMMDMVDIIFSIGGDIYTIPEVERRKTSYLYYNSLVDFCDRAINCGKKVIVYGASIGPFGHYCKALSYYKNNLERYSGIICREEISMDYLRSLLLQKVFFLPDPAFLVRSKEISENLPQYIGINLSPLSLNQLYGNCDAQNIQKLAVLVDTIYERFGIDLLFIPHVLSSDKRDNDLLFLKEIKKQMKPVNQAHICFADCSGGFLGIKKQIRSCCMVVSARMHCAINAACENVPVLFLSYSQKSVGMCNYIYGSTDWLIDLKNIEEQLLLKMEAMLNQREDIVRNLQIRNAEIERYYQENGQRIMGQIGMEE